MKVTMDVFSGRPNPSWELDEDAGHALLRRLSVRRGVISPVDRGFDGLGFRGLVIEGTEEGMTDRYGLPDRFRISGGDSVIEAEGIEIALSMISDAPTQDATILEGLSTDFRSEIMAVLERRLAFAAIEEEPPTQEPETESTLSCGWETATFTPSYWNDPAYIWSNNCYNFATAKRTNTFAQPGRGSGSQFTALTCDNVQAAAKRDGAVKDPMCASPAGIPRHLTALVIWSGNDYHWYRRVSQGYWAHKPGHTAARNYDNSGHVIYNPYTCNRWPYTVFCGWFYCPRTMYVR